MPEGYSARRSRQGLSAAVGAAVLVIVALVGVTSVFLIENGGSSQLSTSTASSSASMISRSASSTSVRSPASGLELSLTLNSSSTSTGLGIAATAVELNTLTTPNNVSAAADWPIGNLSAGPCGHSNEPVGIEVLRGDYDAANVSSASALQLYKPGTYACPAILSEVSGFVFQPSSDNATVLGACQPGPCFNETISASVSVSGYWTGNSFTSFPSGVYTVVAGDEWGGMATVHFTVKGSGP
jgi:hypothetical protein